MIEKYNSAIQIYNELNQVKFVAVLHSSTSVSMKKKWKLQQTELIVVIAIYD